MEATDSGRERARALEDGANEAMRAYVMERPHTATVYGLVASMQSGRFTVEDLLEFLAEGPTGHRASRWGERWVPDRGPQPPRP